MIPSTHGDLKHSVNLVQGIQHHLLAKVDTGTYNSTQTSIREKYIYS